MNNYAIGNIYMENHPQNSGSGGLEPVTSAVTGQRFEQNALTLAAA
jgi:hypothetical protein